MCPVVGKEVVVAIEWLLAYLAMVLGLRHMGSPQVAAKVLNPSATEIAAVTTSSVTALSGIAIPSKRYLS